MLTHRSRINDSQRGHNTPGGHVRRDNVDEDNQTRRSGLFGVRRETITIYYITRSRFAVRNKYDYIRGERERRMTNGGDDVRSKAAVAEGVRAARVCDRPQGQRAISVRNRAVRRRDRK